MDDNEVCPLCCEELDISDKQFFPCKCGYQVCMWCWHRIRESESGLCPACRTPYGDDPHEFSAVDVQEVLKANKEKAAAEKREKDRMKNVVPQKSHHQSSPQGGHPYHLPGSDGLLGSGPTVAGLLGNVGSVGPSGHFLSAAAVAAAENSIATPLDNSSGIINLAAPENKASVIDRSRSSETPKDRSSLANMRVIRRTLVYAVGLPQDIATEALLSRPEYFGQYGRISKIVINRNYNGNGDPRRASASAYVTFVHKEDTLACILALDGFVLDGRHIRASYGTSKYCSAFIKNVRCNNPECTYLHHLGLPEDSFTKQEIQAGYVTSGRDVLAKQQAAMAAAASVNGLTRKRVGGGGPSGTGVPSFNPVLPAPEFDEPIRTTKAGANYVTPLAPLKHARSISIGSNVTAVPSIGNGSSGFAAVTAGAVPIPGTSSNSSSPGLSASGTVSGAKVRPLATVTSLPSKSSATVTTIPAPTAASVVASAKSSNNSPPSVPAPQYTLTALTPLKRSTSLPSKPPPSKSTTSAAQASTASANSTNTESTSIKPIRKPLGAIGSSRKTNTIESSMSSDSYGEPDIDHSESNIAGDTIGGTAIFGSGFLSDGSTLLSTSRASPNGLHPGQTLSVPNRSFGAIGSSSSHDAFGASSIGAIGMKSVGTRAHGSNFFSGTSDLHWKSGDTQLPSLMGIGGLDASGLWGAGVPGLNSGNTLGGGSGGGFGVIGKKKQSFSKVPNEPINRAPGGDVFVSGSSNVGAGGIFGRDSGTSALASMLGISLPAEGSGSLRETLAGPAPGPSAPFSFSSVPIGGLGQRHNGTNQDPLWPQNANQNGGPSSAYQPSPIGARNPIGPSHHKGIDHNFKLYNGLREDAGGTLIAGLSHRAHRSNFTSGGQPSADRPVNSDIALLQTLLPGVHVTTATNGNPTSFSAVSSDDTLLSGWRTNPAPIGSGRQSAIGGGVSLGNLSNTDNSTWGSAGGFYVGGSNQNSSQTQSQQQPPGGSSIW